MSTAYKVREGFRVPKNDAKVIGQRLEYLGRGDFQSVTAAEFLRDARQKDSPTHQLFAKKGLWDDRKAAEQARLEYARYLMRAVEIEVVLEKSDRPPKPMKAVVVTLQPHPVDQEKNRRAYAPVVELMKNDDQRDQILQEAKREMRSWVRRYEAYSWLSEHVEKVIIILTELEKVEF